MEKEAIEIIKEICFLLLELKEAYQESSSSNQVPWIPGEQQIRFHVDALLASYSIKEFERKLKKLRSIIHLHISVNQIRKIPNEEKFRINELLEKLQQELAYLLEHFTVSNRLRISSNSRASSYLKYE